MPAFKRGEKKIAFLAVETLPLKQRHKLFISLRNFLSKRRCQVFAAQDRSTLLREAKLSFTHRGMIWNHLLSISKNQYVKNVNFLIRWEPARAAHVKQKEMVCREVSLKRAVFFT